MSPHKFALPEPQAVSGGPDDGSVMELARVWTNRGMPDMMVRPAISDPRIMGAMLAELCWTFAAAYEQRGIPQDQALAALREGWTEGHARGDAAHRRGQ